MKIKIEEITTKIKILDDKKTKAIIGLDFGEFVVRGLEYKNHNTKTKRRSAMANSPSYLGGGRYHPIFLYQTKICGKSLNQKYGKIITNNWISIIKEV